MYIANGKSLDDFPELRDHINNETHEIRKEKDTVFFDDIRVKTVKVKTIDGQSVSITPSWIPLREKINIPQIGSYTIGYSAGMPKIDSNGHYSLITRRLRLHETLAIDPKSDYELIWFLRNCSSLVKVGTIKERDVEAEYAEDVSKYTPMNDANYLIMSPNSPINPDNDNGENMRFIARAWGVRKVDEISINNLKLRLRDAVASEEKNKTNTGRGYEDFIKEAKEISTNVSDDLKIRHDIMLGLNKGVIEYYKRDWKFVIFPGQEIERQLLKIRPSDEPVRISRLINEFKLNKGKYDLLLNEIYEPMKAEYLSDAKEGDMIEKINNPTTHLMTLKKLCRDAEPPMIDTGSVKEIRDRLKDHYNC